jgi:hypothetical protein
VNQRGTMSESAVKGWEYVLWIDLDPLPGAWVSQIWHDYTIEGETINAANYYHAEYIWLGGQVKKSGGELHVCQRCHHAIRYAVAFRDEQGLVYHVGEDCAEFVCSQLDRKAWAEKKLLSEMKAVKTKNGERFVLSIKVPDWFWNIPKEVRPRFTSLSKYTKPGRQKEIIWYLSIWGETAWEVLANWDALQQLRKQY